MLFVVYVLLFVGCRCVLYVACCVLFGYVGVCCLLFVVWALFVVSYCALSFVGCLFVGCSCLVLLVVCCLLFVVVVRACALLVVCFWLFGD